MPYFTGAPMPKGADTVVIQENVERQTITSQSIPPPQKGANVRKKEKSSRLETVSLPKGTPVRVGLVGLFKHWASRRYLYTKPPVSPSSPQEMSWSIDQQQNLALGQIWSSNNHTRSVQRSQVLVGYLLIVNRTRQSRRHHSIF